MVSLFFQALTDSGGSCSCPQSLRRCLRVSNCWVCAACRSHVAARGSAVPGAPISHPTCCSVHARSCPV
ncbi:hypothetical protein DUNSADRAFT_5821 [Dunaliella salina]|uniref:Encoded protein n=1 Tax=Dunaliella salina TaxID=3046 RepID=A0ABQ7GPK0_DUNSA|nr:hypothetical protein DUNSADRAFT_5821 [Dunaliella salina]|eukprot:KAF5836533.1 hypothetical protein DUNSADRAFT_5821 [Dunaliella salina]